MANRNPSDSYYYDEYQTTSARAPGALRYSDGPTRQVRPVRPAGTARPAGTRPAGTTRPAGSTRPTGSARPAGTQTSRYGTARPEASRYGTGAPRNNPPRRPQKKRRKAKGRFFVFVAIAVVLLIALILIIAKPFGGKEDPTKTNPVNTDNVTTQTDFAQQALETEPEATEDPGYSSLAQYLADEDAQVQGLSQEEMAQVTNLSINQNLPSEWLNILLLGTDERTLSESARTDTMMICSIHRETGEVKLTSLMRDLNVRLDNIGKYSGEYRLNAAHYFGGANLAMKTINECFGMNIQYYVRVNFFGFQEIAAALGGIDITITEEEMQHINKGVLDQWKQAQKAGIDDSDIPLVELKQFGENVHLDGRQTLAYARIRKTDNDYERARRQRMVLNELLKKVKKMNFIEFTSLATSMLDQVKTNMKIDDILSIAVTVMSNGIGDIDSTRLPVNGTYSEERRNEDSRLWDCDWKANELALYNFIYE